MNPEVEEPIECASGMCSTLPVDAPYSAAGNTLCCPAGMTAFGDGSACKGGGKSTCTLYGKPTLPLCASVTDQGESNCRVEEPIECASGMCSTLPVDAPYSAA